MSRSLVISGALVLVAVLGGVAVAGHSAEVGEWGLGLSPDDVTVAYSEDVVWTGSLTCEESDASGSVDPEQCPSVDGEDVAVDYTESGAGAWTPVGTATTSSDGSWSLAWQADVAPGTYEVRARHDDGAGDTVESDLSSLTVTKEQTTTTYTGAVEGESDAEAALSAIVADHDAARVAGNPPSGDLTFELRDAGGAIASVTVALTAGADAATASAPLSLEGLGEGSYTLVVAYAGDSYYDGSATQVAFTVVQEDEEEDEGRAAPAWANWHVKQVGYTYETCFPDGTNHNNRNWRGVVLSQVARHPDFTGRLFTEDTAEVVFEFVDELCAQNEGPPERDAVGGPSGKGGAVGEGGPPPHAGGHGRDR